ncbi:DNA repair exonuclease SbcCD ATPase subunit [Bacillus fengqiuensis]|nr:DNA repair exonuclease SbcCD ATPase subunit [Bacillus fengqiuensis]
MRYVNKMKKMGLLAAVVLGLTACANSSSPQIDIYKALEEVVTSEKQFSKQQQPLVELEKKEKEKYDQIISLGMKEHKQIQRLSDEALNIVKKREERIQQEKKSMDESKEKFQVAVELIQDLEEEEYKKEAESLIVLMNKRYDSYDALHKQYEKAVQLDRQLYEMFKKNDVKLDELEKQITTINKTYEQIMKANEEFNQLTKQYNEAKVGLYKKAGLEVAKENQKESVQ